MKKQILAVDDSKAIRFLLQTVLGRDYSVITVPDGYSAMYYLSHRAQPDLIIVDPQLPDMDNWELIQQLSTSGMYGDIPMVVLSGLPELETDAKCNEYGVVKYFLKPFNPVEMMGAIEKMVTSGELNRDISYAS
ncbi:MAG TPA: response regulator [Puia sp.]|jgi:CheY-like chemotaxis protein|nr:response regulator [Puia sp.]